MNDSSCDKTLRGARFSGDIETQQVIENDPELNRLLEMVRPNCCNGSLRQHYLSNAVRVDPKVLPGLARSFDDIHQRTHLDAPMEAYVFSHPEINAYVVRGGERIFVVLSSGAVERLAPDELDFIIGHELGHASFGHLNMPVNLVLNGTQEVSAKQAMQFLAWQRKAEISADRAGLLCCGSLETAATALFKTLSGLAIDGVGIDPREFAEQWNDLAREVARDGGSGKHWMATHPFPPLRMKALISFWDSDVASSLIPEALGSRPCSEADTEIESLLAMMDPLAREDSETSDPLLREFFLWGGLYVAVSNNDLDEREIDNIRSVVGREAVDSTLAQGQLSPALCREKFLAARSHRTKPLSAIELHRIFSGLVAVASADGEVDSQEIAALQDLATACGVSGSFVDVALSKAA